MRLNLINPALALALLSAASLAVAPVTGASAQQATATHSTKHGKKIAKHRRAAPATPRAQTRSEPQRSPVFEQHDARQGY